VTSSSFFIVETPAAAAQVTKAAIDDTICDPAMALAASIACPSFLSCTLDPGSDLENNTIYSICLMPSITFADGSPFEGFMATFTTEAGVNEPTLKLVKLDGSTMELGQKPIPLSVSVQATFPAAVTDTATAEADSSIVDDKGNTVAVTYTWSSDNVVLTMKPTKNLKYRTTYHVLAGGVSAAKSPIVDEVFTTMTKNDINGDGYADLLVDAYWGGAVTAAGKLYIFYGTADGIVTCDISAGCTPGASLAGATNDNMGISNAVAGDVNGDGYADIIVGAPQRTGTRTGTAYVFAGGTTLTGTLATTQALATISNAAGNDDLGNSVAGAGDMNNDGYDDVVIGAPKANGGTGRAFVFLGGPSFTGTLDVASASQTVTGQALDSMAAMVDGAGDVNGDGFDDMILSTGHAMAYVFYGAATLTAARNASAADSIITGPNNSFGRSVAGVGDINGDGKADAMVGQPVINSGVVYVFLGTQLTGAINAATASTIITETSGNDDIFGRTLTGAGDIDGDGKDDLLIGGDTASPAADRGAAYVFLAKNLQAAMTDANADTTIRGNLANFDLLSLGLTGAVDFNNDGFDDIALGAPQTWAPGKGLTYIFNGSASGITSCTFTAPASCSPAATLTGATQDALGIMGTTWYLYP
jgi:hypothetical protein